MELEIAFWSLLIIASVHSAVDNYLATIGSLIGAVVVVVIKIFIG